MKSMHTVQLHQVHDTIKDLKLTPGDGYKTILDRISQDGKCPPRITTERYAAMVLNVLREGTPSAYAR
jgi:hypothetical protein